MIFETTTNDNGAIEEMTIETFGGSVQLYVTEEFLNGNSTGAGITLNKNQLTNLRDALNELLD